MNFFKDPKYKLVRIVLLLVIIIGAGWFIMSNMNLSKSNQGRVINPAPKGDEVVCGKAGDDCPCCSGYLCSGPAGEPEDEYCRRADSVFGPRAE